MNGIDNSIRHQFSVDFFHVNSMDNWTFYGAQVDGKCIDLDF